MVTVLFTLEPMGVLADVCTAYENVTTAEESAPSSVRGVLNVHMYKTPLLGLLNSSLTFHPISYLVIRR